MSVGAVGSSSRSSAASSRGVSALQADASLTADPQGNLTLTPPPGKHPISISKGDEGRYHVNVGNQDIAFTPEQMKRLDIRASQQNPITMTADVDLPVKVNGKPHERGPDGSATAVKGKGFESIPEVAGDGYQAANAQAGSTAQQNRATSAAGLNAAQQVDAAGKADASRAVKGNNWDGVGVPQANRVDAKAESRGAGDQKLEQQKAGQDHPDAKKAEDEKKTKEPEEKKKPKQVQFVQVLDPTGGEGVDVKNMGDVIRVEEKVSMERWKKFFQNMAGGGGASALDGSDLMGAAQTEVAGVRAEALSAQLAARAQTQALQDPSLVAPPQDTVGTDNNPQRAR